MPDTLPANPYTRKPIRARSLLAGRSEELEQIEYFFGLTASGQSPHIALIGERGVGKTSLLITCAESARTTKLLPVVIDMNDKKASSQGTFWQQFYSSICLSAARIGCWGGIQGDIYSAFSEMIDCQKMVAGAYPLLFPKTLPDFRGHLDDLICSDALIEYDIKAIKAELVAQGFTGAAILIDEADCLRHDPAMLQVLRNVFQKIDGFSLVLAGTENLFSQISDVFSPIPRQFHKLEIKGFSHWGGTRELVYKPIPKELHHLLPRMSEIEQLHKLCNGDPAELQLYCHHMYKNLEGGETSRMRLSPQIFKSVLAEYRSTTPEDAQLVIKNIERLPREVFLNYRWLQYSSLNLEENTRLAILRAGLESLSCLEESETKRIEETVTLSYNLLFEKGISTARDLLKIPGGAAIKGFWKSFVEVDLGERWIWREESLSAILIDEALSYLIKRSSSVCSLIDQEDYGQKILKAVLDGEITDQNRFIHTEQGPVVLHQYIDLIRVIDQAYKTQAVKFLRIPVRIKLDRLSISCVLTTLEYDDILSKEAELHRIYNHKKDLFRQYGIEITIGKPAEWRVPNEDELEQLQESVGVKITLDDGQDMAQAIQLFRNGKINESADQLQQIVERRRSPSSLNNLAFCKIVMGQLPEAKKLLNEAISKSENPLFRHNKAIINYLEGSHGEAISLLKKALLEISTNKRWAYIALFMFIADKEEAKFQVKNDLPVGIGILMSLHNLRALSDQDLDNYLTNAYEEREEQDKWRTYIKGEQK